MELIKIARWFDGLFRRKPKSAQFAPTFNGSVPWYSSFGNNIYNDITVQQAIKCIADEMKKLIPTHVRYVGNDPVPVKGSVQDVLDNPNEIMTTAEFLEKIVYLLMLNLNCFVIPVYSTWIDEKTGAEKRYYEALYPINYDSVVFEDDAGELYVTFWLRNGKQTTIPYRDVIPIRENFSIGEYMGGNEYGQPDNAALLKTLKTYHGVKEGIEKSAKAAYAVNGIVHYHSVVNKEATEQALQEFTQALRNNEDGFVALDQKSEYVPIEHKGEIVKADLLKFLDEQVLRNYGVPLCILSGDYTKEQYQAFYQKTLEPKIKMISQAFTKHMFTAREKAFGNRIELFPQELIFMNPQQTLDLINTIAPMGGGYVNEYRVWLGLRPLPELEGKRLQSLNWIDADNANQYQVGKVNVDVVDEEKTVE